jgi:hypothetical protein
LALRLETSVSCPKPAESERGWCVSGRFRSRSELATVDGNVGCGHLQQRAPLGVRAPDERAGSGVRGPPRGGLGAPARRSGLRRRGWLHGRQRRLLFQVTGEMVRDSFARTARRWRHLYAARQGELYAVFGVTAGPKGSVRVDPIVSRLRAGSSGAACCTGPRLIETSSQDALRRRAGLCCFTLLRQWSLSNDRIGSPSVATSTNLSRWESVCAARIASRVRGRRVRGRSFGA